MKKVLVPVDGSVRTARAITYLIELAANGERPEVVVMNVQPKPKLWQTRGIATKAIFERLRMLGEVATSHSVERMKSAAIAHQCRLELADSEIEAIARSAREEGCDHIVMAGEDQHPWIERLKHMGLWPFRSLAARVVDRTELPVTVVRAEAVERINSRRGAQPATDDRDVERGAKRLGPTYRFMAQ